MKIIKRFLLLLAVLLPIFSLSNVPLLSEFNYGSASVLPFYKRGKAKYFILSRERWGRDKGTYDDFGGKRDKGEKHPVISAAREFWEEAILDQTVGLTLKQTQDYIDITKSENTLCVVANTTHKDAKNVTYITDFSDYTAQFIDTFYTARFQATQTKNKEKDRIALVKWDDLKDAILNQPAYNDPVYVLALVVNPITKKKRRQDILLRPYLVIKLSGFFRDAPYESGRNPKIRFYTTHMQPAMVSQQYDLKKIAQDAHKLYESFGDQCTQHMFISAKSGQLIPVSVYIEALEQEKSEIEQELEKSSFLYFFHNRRLKNEYNDVKKILDILYNYTQYY